MKSHKIMLLGEIGVGKTSLVRRLVDDQFVADYGPTTGVDLYHYTAHVETPAGTQDAGLVIWDTDGDFGQSIFRHAYITGAAGALIIGDATRRHTQETMLSLAEAFQDTFPARPFAFVLNKLDLIEGGTPTDLPEKLAASDEFYQTSAKTGENVKQAFHDAAATIIRRQL